MLVLCAALSTQRNNCQGGAEQTVKADLRDWIVERELGHGTFGVVELVRHAPSGSLLARKVCAILLYNNLV